MLYTALVRVLALMILSLSSLWLAWESEAAEPLRWKLKAGDRFDVVMKQSNKQVMNDALEVPHDTTMWITWVVEQIQEDDSILLSQTIDRITVMIEVPGQGKMSYDSSQQQVAQGPAQTIALMMQPMVGAKLTQTMNRRGKVLDVVIPDEALQGFRRNPMLAQLMSDEIMKDMFTKSAPEFPEEALARGQEWNTNQETKSPLGVMKIQNTFTYQGQENRDGRQLDRVGSTANIEMGDAPAQAVGATVNLVDQESAGVLFFDNQAGYLVESRMVQNMTMDVALLGNTVRQKLESIQHLTIQPSSEELPDSKPED